MNIVSAPTIAIASDSSSQDAHRNKEVGLPNLESVGVPALESENSRWLWLSEIPCWKGFQANFDTAANHSPFLRQHEMQSLPRFGHFPARSMAAGKSGLRELSWIFSSETATAFLSFSDSRGVIANPLPPKLSQDPVATLTN